MGNPSGPNGHVLSGHASSGRRRCAADGATGRRTGPTGRGDRGTASAVLDLERELRQPLRDRAVELALVLLVDALVERAREVVADVGEELRARLDRVDVVAVELLGLVAVGARCTPRAARAPPRSRPGCRARTGRAGGRSPRRSARGGRSRELPVERQVLRGRRVPGQLRPRALGARARGGERRRVAEQLARGLGQRLDVARRGRRGRRRSARSARRGRRRRRRSPGCPRRAPAASRPTGRARRGTGRSRPSRPRARGRTRPAAGSRAATRVRGASRSPSSGIAGSPATSSRASSQPAHDLDRVGEPLVRPDHAEREQRRAVVGARRRRSGRRGAGSTRASTPSSRSVSRPRSRVDDDAVEAREQPPPEVALARPSAAAAGRAP